MTFKHGVTVDHNLPCNVPCFMTSSWKQDLGVSHREGGHSSVGKRPTEKLGVILTRVRVQSLLGNSKHWFTVSFLQPLLYLVVP